MIILFIIGILLGAMAVVFALQNIAVITVTFFSWELTGSLALVLLMTILSGMLISIFLLLPQFIRNHFKFKNLQKEKENLTEELRKQKELTIFAKRPTEVEATDVL
ncbi:MAG: LapA family protein [Minisyncoccia bacterium]